MKEEPQLPIFKTHSDERCKSGADCSACSLAFAADSITVPEFNKKASGLRTVVDKYKIGIHEQMLELAANKKLLAVCPRVEKENAAGLLIQIEKYNSILRRQVEFSNRIRD
jgi:hypothetical protein